MTGLAAGILLQMALLTTSAQPYDQALTSAKADGQPLLVLIGADWCPGCRTMKHSVLAGMEQRGRLKDVNYAVIDADRDAALARQMMRGNSIPQVIVFSKTADGWHREQVTGAVSEGHVQGMLARATAAAKKSTEAAAQPATEVASKTDSQ